MLSKVKKESNMYSWVTHTHSHLAGACPHHCCYCYVQAMAKKFSNLKERYSGPIRLIEKEFDVDYGTGKTIFIEHMNDLFADAVPSNFITRILGHCLSQQRDNQFVFQSKNPSHMVSWAVAFPRNSLLGTTIETNCDYKVSEAPNPESRFHSIRVLRSHFHFQTFITIEPILDFDLKEFVDAIIDANPSFVNIGADSKGSGLPEPDGAKVRALIAHLQNAGVIIKTKSNLQRLLVCQAK